MHCYGIYSFMSLYEVVGLIFAQIYIQQIHIFDLDTKFEQKEMKKLGQMRKSLIRHKFTGI